MSRNQKISFAPRWQWKRGNQLGHDKQALKTIENVDLRIIKTKTGYHCIVHIQ